MANSVIETKIPIALPSSSKLDLTCDHQTTMMFGEYQPVHYRHPIKGEHLNLCGTGVIRPFPMAAPTFGRMRCNIHHFYVPWRLVFPQWDYLENDTIAVNYNNTSLVQGSPIIKNDDLVKTFTSVVYVQPTGNTTLSTVSSSNNPYDFQMSDGTYRRFTSMGKFFYKILCSLGYAINWNVNDTAEYSALPLLAYGKIYVDYYANQAYLDDQNVLELRKMFSYNDPTQPLVLSTSQIASLFYSIRHCQYEQDYYVGSWDNPFAPNSNQYSAITLRDITNEAQIVTVSGSFNGQSWAGLPQMQQNQNSLVSLGTQYLHDALKAITDYSKRHALAGANNISRTLAQYGFAPAAMKLDRAIHLEGGSIDIDTGAVFSTANTAAAGSTSTLGDYAGNGYGSGVTDFDYSVEEYGIQISIASIMPSAGLVQGMDENNMHLNRFDFYTPEFDGLGVQVLRKREVYMSDSGAFAGANYSKYDDAFAWTGRYGEYKRPRSWLTGDFRCPSRFAGASAWHLFRLFDDTYWNNDIDNVVHSNDFTMLEDSEQFRRVFANTKTDADPFYAEFHWAVGSYAPCHGLFEGYEMETDGNKSVTLQSNGALVN